MPDAEVERALVVVAHPDDADFGAAGTVANWTDAGIAVTYLIVTDGDAGGSDRSLSRAQIRDVRHREQRAAGAVVGVTDVRFLGYPDGALEETMALRRDISRVIRQVRPRRAIVQTPEWNLSFFQAACHPDHQHAGAAALRAVYPDARNPFAHPELLADEGLEPWSVVEAWVMASAHADLAVDVSANLGRKLAAIASHVSQLPPDAGDLTAVGGIGDRIRSFTADNARRHGLPEGAHAEQFEVVVLR